MSERTFNHTRLALVTYDASHPERDQAWAAASTNEDIDAAIAADDMALRDVQEAFYLDTSDINSLDNCHRVDIGFMRRMATLKE